MKKKTPANVITPIDMAELMALCGAGKDLHPLQCDRLAQQLMAEAILFLNDQPAIASTALELARLAARLIRARAKQEPRDLILAASRLIQRASLTVDYLVETIPLLSGRKLKVKGSDSHGRRGNATIQKALNEGVDPRVRKDPIRLGKSNTELKFPAPLHECLCSILRTRKTQKVNDVIAKYDAARRGELSREFQRIEKRVEQAKKKAAPLTPKQAADEQRLWQYQSLRDEPSLPVKVLNRQQYDDLGRRVHLFIGQPRGTSSRRRDSEGRYFSPIRSVEGKFVSKSKKEKMRY